MTKSSQLSPLLVAEVSSNHGRSLERALAFIEAAAAVGCGAVKFQQFKIAELFAPSALDAHPELLERRAWELPEEFHRELSERAHARGLEYQVTPFYLGAVDVLEPFVDRFKVASYQVLWHDLLKKIARTAKPVVLATGMASMDEVRRAVDVLGANGCNDLTVLHCVSLYPLPPSLANLRGIETLRAQFGLPVGWSDHSRSADVVERAVGRFGARLIELHLDLDGQGEEYASGHCWLPEEVRKLRARIAEQRELPLRSSFDGTGEKVPLPEEQHEAAWRSDPSDGLRPLRATRAREGFRLELDAGAILKAERAA